jgi:hypothetical protein
MMFSGSRSILLFAFVALICWGTCFAAREPISARVWFPSAPRPASSALASVAIEFYHNRVYVPVMVNGAGPFQLVLDTGASLSGVSDPRAQQLKLEIKGKADIAGNGETPSHVQLAKNVSFHLGAADLLEPSIAVVPFEEMQAYEGRVIDGVLGVNLFHKYVVEIDYAGKSLNLYDPKSYVYSGQGEIIPLRVLNGGTLALVHATIEIQGQNPIGADLAVDSGTYSALRLYRPFTEKHNLLAANPSALPSFDFGIGGEFRDTLGRVQTLQIGQLVIDQPLTGFSQAAIGATATAKYDGTIGGEILHRFKVILDYSRQQMIIEPNVGFYRPYEADMSGLILLAEGKTFETIKVRHVLEKTPAAEAGLREGDVIAAIDDKSAAELGLQQIRSLFSQEGTHSLKIKRADQPIQVDIHTRRLI